MLKKISFLSVLAIFVIATSCKKETTISENDISPKQLEKITPASVEAIPKMKAPEPTVDGKYPVITFAETEFNFGEIKQGDKVEHTFAFKNTGEADLIISNAQASCGCTVPEYPKNTPIKPGESGNLKVTFNSAGKSGQTMKTITVSCNTESGSELLKIKTTINVPNKELKK